MVTRFSALSVVAIMLVCSRASADEKHAVTIKTTTVYGHPQRPSVAIEVSRAKMELGATTPTLASVMKIQDASKKDPF